MNLNQLFSKKKVISEGGNASSHKDDGTPTPGWQGIPGQHQAQELDLNVHNRTYVVSVLSDLLHKINDLFAQQFKEPLWHENSVAAQKFLSGSTLRFFDKKISDEEFLRVKPKVGDIDTQAPDKHAKTIEQFLTGLIGKKVGNAKFVGFGPGNNQYISIWEILLKDLPIKIQIDFEYGSHDPETGLPTEWQEYSHSSSWEDLSAGIKGVFHKYIDRALPYAANVTTKYVARVLKTGTKISPATVTDSDYSFAVSGQGGGGVSRKYIPYNDPNTGEPMEKDGIPVMQLLDPKNRQYIQKLSQQFEIFFGKKPTAQDQQLKNSFIGTVQLANKYLDDAERTELFKRFVSICFEPGTQMITKGDPIRDRNTKMAAIDYMVENMSLPNAAALRKQAIQTAIEYEQAFTAKKAAKAPAPLAEAAEVKAQFRKGMPHLRDLKPLDLLDLLDEIHDGNGSFKLQNIPLNVKIDGFGGRFGKDAEGKPFMATSNTPPRYKAGFVQYHQEKGTTDPEILGRAEKFDQLFNQMMAAIELIDNKLGPDFLVNKQVTCEVLFLPFATETPEGKLKFVGIKYDKLPEGIQLALVPFRVVDAATGEDLPDAQAVVKKLTGVGKQGSVMFIDNSLTQKEGLDVTAIVPPIENLEQIKALVQSNKLVDKRSAKEQLAPVALALEQAIQNDPNILGKDILGQDYEGIVINSRLGPIKVTSPEQKKVIADKQAAKAAARTEQPRTGNKTAVVAVGSFAGHKGHQQLFGLTIDKATSLGGDPYLFMGSRVGKDDPIPINDKIKTWKMLYPQYANNISAVTHDGGSLMQKIKHELINPLPGKPPRYDNVVIMTGKEDNPKENKEKEKWPSILMKAVNKFQGYEHVKSSIEFTSRGTGMSFTKLRNVLKTGDEQQASDMWNDAFNGGQDGAKPLPAAWIKHLMDVSRTGMGVQQKPAVQQPAAPAIGEMRLFNALMKSSLNELSSEKLGQYKKAAGAQASAADKAGDTKKADKRFSGIVKATKKQFANDEKGVAEGLNEFAPGGNSASSYYAVTSNFVNDFAQQKQEELQDLIDAGWTKQDLAQAGTLQGQAADIAHLEQVRDGFLKGLKPGFDAYLSGDTQMKDQLGEYWLDNDLPLNQDWEKIYGEPWGNDGINEGVTEGLDEAVGGNYLYHATSAGGLKGMLSSGSIRSATGPQAATSAQTRLPTVSVTRDWGYASGSNAVDQMAGIGRDAILVLDRNAVESNFKTLGTSQNTNIRGLAFNPYLKKDGEARSQNTDPAARANAKAKAKYAEPTAKAGGEFEEAVVVPKGALPLKGTLVGFWINPKSELMKDPAVMNDPRRLDMVRPNQFVKATQEQGVAEKFDPRKMKSTNDTDVRTVGAGAIRVPSGASRTVWNEPTWSFKEIADKLGVSTNMLNLLAWKQIGGFPEAVPGLKASKAYGGSSKYYKQSEVKRWVNANKVREFIKGKITDDQGVAERMLPKSAFAGSDKNKLAPQGQLKGTAPKKYPKNKLVGENKCVPIGEAYEVEMALAILKLFEDKK